MAADSSKEYTVWLKSKLRELNTDDSIFGEYILGIVDSDETLDEKTEALQGLLGELFVDNLDEIVTSILNKWTEFCQNAKQPAKKEPQIDVNEQLAKMLEAKLANTVPKEREITEEERRIKEQILAQYSQTEISGDEDDGAVGVGASNSGGGGSEDTQKQTGLARNTNVEDVKQLQKERREQARMDSAAKKLKDKEDRQKQKQEREEKKEKRKTVKGERRR